MAEYIEREAAVAFAQHAYNAWNLAMAAADGRREINMVYKRQELCKAVKSVFSEMPAADVAPVVHGRWIDTGEKDTDGNAWFVCNICGHRDLHAPLMDVPHCWFCGAKMNGGKA